VDTELNGPTVDVAGDHRIDFVSCAELDAETFERFYREVLAPSFRPDELVDLGLMGPALRAADSSEFGTVVLRGGEAVAGMFGEQLPTSGVVLLGYAAVRPDLRGSGIGSTLLAAEIPRWRARAGGSLFLAEVDDPRFHPPDSYGDPTARLRLYDRLGAHLLPVPHVQPELRPTSGRVRGMLLISLGSQRDSVAADDVGRFLDEYYEICEGTEVLRSDPEYLALRQRVSGWPGGRMPLWPVSRFPDLPPLTIEGDGA